MSFAAASLRLSAGVMVWILHFAVIYGFTALACARDAPRVVPWLVAGATVAAAAACIAIALKAFGTPGRFEPWLGGALAVAALFAVVLEALPILMLRPCA